MTPATKRFVFSSSDNWKHGFSRGLTIEKGNLFIDREYFHGSNFCEAVYISTSIDSTGTDTIWHRMLLESQVPEDANIYFSFFASNHRTITYEGKEMNIDTFILNRDISVEEKEKTLKGFWVGTTVNPSDILLHKARGRHLWFKIDLVSYGNNSPVIKKLRIEFPLETIVSYLPEIYQQNQASFDLVIRFLGIFQSLIYDLDEEIINAAKYFDPDVADKQFLDWLARWFAIEDIDIWPEDKLRYLIKNAYRLYRIKGTRQSIEEIVELYTEEKPIIVENFEVSGYNTKLYRNLYGDNPYTFSVLVEERSIETPQQYIELKQIIERFKPAHTILNLVVLQPYISLDKHSYLGINSKLSGSDHLVLDGKSTIPFATTLADNGEAQENEK